MGIHFSSSGNWMLIFPLVSSGLNHFFPVEISNHHYWLILRQMWYVMWMYQEDRKKSQKQNTQGYLSWIFPNFSNPIQSMNFKSRRIWGWFVPKTFQGLHFLYFESLSWWIAIWAICPWNKFEEKAKCGASMVAFSCLLDL